MCLSYICLYVCLGLHKLLLVFDVCVSLQIIGSVQPCQVLLVLQDLRGQRESAATPDTAELHSTQDLTL